MSYRFKPGFRARSVTAEVAHTEMERLRADGALTARRLFEAALPAKAALHAEFTLDGKQAVQELGLMRARQLLRAVEVVDDAVPEMPPQRVYVHVPPIESAVAEGVYMPQVDVVQQADLYGRAVDELRRKFASAESALRELEAVARGVEQPDRLAAISLAVQGFATVREALALLKAA